MWKKFILMFVIMLSTAFMFQSCETEEVVSPPPTEIVQYVEAIYPDAEIVIVKYDKRDKEYDVVLSNGWELTFNKDFKLIDADI